MYVSPLVRRDVEVFEFPREGAVLVVSAAREAIQLRQYALLVVDSLLVMLQQTARDTVSGCVAYGFPTSTVNIYALLAQLKETRIDLKCICVYGDDCTS